VDNHKEATDKFAVVIKIQTVKPPTKSVAGCNPASVNLFWTVYQNSNNFRYKSFLDSLIFAKNPTCFHQNSCQNQLGHLFKSLYTKMNFETE
jgi:hypothetical protein